jgi:hypothetical protein
MAPGKDVFNPGAVALPTSIKPLGDSNPVVSATTTEVADALKFPLSVVVKALGVTPPQNPAPQNEDIYYKIFEMQVRLLISYY